MTLLAPRLHERHVGDDQVHAELIRLGEHDTGVDEDCGVLPRHGHHVHAELAEASKRYDLERRRRHVRYGGLIHSETSESECVDCAYATGTLAGPRSRIRRLGAPQNGQAQRLPAKIIAQLETAAPCRRGSALRGVYVGQLRARSISSAADRPSESATGFSALPSVFRRCRKRPRTSFSKVSRSPTSRAGGRKRRRTTADFTFGGGRNAPGGSDRMRSASASKRHLNRERAVHRRTWLGHQPVRHFLLEHERGVSKQPALVRVVEQLEQDWRRDVVGKVPDDANRRWRSSRSRSDRLTSRKSACTSAQVREAERAGPQPGRDRFLPRRRASTRAASGTVKAPRPGPISRNVSSGSVASASTSFATQAGSRKCWPNRLRACPERGRRALNPPPQSPASPRANIAPRFLRSLPRSARSSGPTSWISVSPITALTSSSSSQSSSIGF